MTTNGEDAKMAKEPNLLDPEVEKEGAKAVFDALTAEEKASLPDEGMTLRYFRAEKGNIPKAIKKIKETLKWRSDFDVDRIIRCFSKEGNDDEEMQNILLEEHASGKLYVRGYDCNGRATLYMRPAAQNTAHEENQMRLLTYGLERAIACTKQQTGGRLEKVIFMVDYEGYRVKHTPPLSTVKSTLRILEGHYPERLFKAYVCNPPFIFRAFWTLIKPLMDPVTKEKIVFCHGDAGVDMIRKGYDLDHVERCAGGVDGKYCKPFDHIEYLKEIPFEKSFGEDLIEAEQG